MALPIYRYPLDKTGTNPDNFVSRETHELQPKNRPGDVRVTSPTYGPFYAESFQMWDKDTGRLLDKGTDYRISELLGDASAIFGKEICQYIVVTNFDVSNTVQISYQALGGNYQNDGSVVQNVFATFLNDTRPVDWTNVTNKPPAYPPSLHMHLLQDIIGFGPLVVALERIRQAILLSNVAMFEALIDWIKNRTLNAVTEEEIRNMLPVDKVVTMERLLYATHTLNFNAVTYRPNIRDMNGGQEIRFTISSTNFPQTETLYWTIRHVGTSSTNFAQVSGYVGVINQEGEFVVNTLADTEGDNRRLTFEVDLRRNAIDGPIIAESGPMTISIGRSGIDLLFELLTACCPRSERFEQNGFNRYILLTK